MTVEMRLGDKQTGKKVNITIDPDNNYIITPVGEIQPETMTRAEKFLDAADKILRLFSELRTGETNTVPTEEDYEDLIELLEKVKNLKNS